MFVIRKATRADVPTILKLVKELALYEREPDAVVATEDDFLRDGFGEHPVFEVLIAEAPEEPRTCAPPGIPSGIVGFALYFFTWSTWVGKRCLHLEDLYVKPEVRGRGAGLALMRALAKAAVDAGCGRFIWQVMDWNAPAIRFYENLGAKVMKESIAVRLEGRPLYALADANSPIRC